MIEHPTVEMTTPDGAVVEIDVELADLLDLAWRAGCRTQWSCQDHGEAVVEPWSSSHLHYLESGPAVYIGFLGQHLENTKTN